MKVQFDHQIFIEQKHGGISRYFAALMSELPKIGVEARAVAPFYINDYLHNLPRSAVVGCKSSSRPVAMAIGRRLGRFANPASARLWGADIVHETFFSATGSAPSGIPTVLTMYDMINELFPEPGTAKTVHRKRAAIARADWIVCISENTRRDLIHFYPEAERKSSVTLLGFDLPPLQAVTASPWPRPYLLYVGQRSGYKNFDSLLAAYAASPRMRRDFDILCAGGSPFTTLQQQAIAAVGATENVVRFAADDGMLQSLYRNAAVFVYPSVYEGFGIPPLEAMAASCPVVAMHVSSVPEVCGDAVEYAQPNDTESLRIAIENVVYSDDRRAFLKSAGHDRLKLFSWSKCADQTLKVYRSLL